MDSWISGLNLKNSSSKPSKSLAQGIGNKKQQNCCKYSLIKS